jgi:hypothetical protein
MGTGITFSGNKHSPDLVLTLRMDDFQQPPTQPHAQGTAPPKSMLHNPDDPRFETFRDLSRVTAAAIL